MDLLVPLAAVVLLVLLVLLVVAAERARPARPLTPGEAEAKARSTGQDWMDPPA